MTSLKRNPADYENSIKSIISNEVALLNSEYVSLSPREKEKLLGQIEYLSKIPNIAKKEMIFFIPFIRFQIFSEKSFSDDLVKQLGEAFLEEKLKPAALEDFWNAILNEHKYVLAKFLRIKSGGPSFRSFSNLKSSFSSDQGMSKMDRMHVKNDLLDLKKDMRIFLQTATLLPPESIESDPLLIKLYNIEKFGLDIKQPAHEVWMLLGHVNLKRGVGFYTNLSVFDDIFKHLRIGSSSHIKRGLIKEFHQEAASLIDLMPAAGPKVDLWFNYHHTQKALYRAISNTANERQAKFVRDIYFKVLKNLLQDIPDKSSTSETINLVSKVLFENVTAMGEQSNFRVEDFSFKLEKELKKLYEKNKLPSHYSILDKSASRKLERTVKKLYREHGGKSVTIRNKCLRLFQSLF